MDATLFPGRNVTNRGHAVVVAVVVCCSIQSAAMGKSSAGRVGSMYGSVAHLVPCDRRPLMPRHASLLPASGQRSAEYGWLGQWPVNRITAREGNNHDARAILNVRKLCRSTVITEATSRTELETVVEPGRRATRENVDEPPQLTWADMHVAVGRVCTTLRRHTANHCGWSKKSNPM
jgi:hypothetical protein